MGTEFIFSGKVLEILKKKVKSEFCFCSTIPVNGLTAIYKEAEERTELITAYIKAGLQQNEHCIWIVPDPENVELAKELLSNSELDIENYIEKSRLKIIPLQKTETLSAKHPGGSGIYLDWNAGVPQKEILKFIHTGNWRHLRINLEVKPFRKSISGSLKELRSILDEDIPEKKIRPLFTIKEEELLPGEVFDIIEAGEKLLVNRDGKWKYLKIKHESRDKKFKTLIESSNDSILIHDMKGRVMEANHVACEILGYTRSKMLGKHIKDLRTGIHLTEFGKQIEKLKQTGYFIFEMDSLRKDGTVTPQEINNRLIEYEGKAAVLSIGRDISERKKNEEALRASERKYRTLFEEFPGGIAQFDAGGVITLCNESFVNLTGNRENEKISFSLLSLLDGGKPDGKSGTCLPEVSVHHDLKHISGNGKGEIPVTITYKPLMSENSGLAGGIVLVEDLTEIKRLETVRLQQTECLRKLVDSVPVPAFCKDRSGIYIACNAAFETFMRMQKEEILGKSMHNFTPSEIAEKCHAMDIELLKHKKTRVYETSTKFADGSMHQIMFNKLVFSGVTEEDSMLLGIMIDITERKQAEEKMLQAKIAAEAANRAKTTFIVNMSHELRTPLNAVIGFSDLLLSETVGPLNEKQKRYTENISKSGSHLLDVINDVLDISRLELGNIELYYETVDISGVIEEVQRVLSSFATEKNILIEYKVEQGLKTVYADRVKFKQILYNLLSNAIKFSSEGGKVNINARSEEDMVEISVKDEGIGINEADYSRVFLPFVQIDESISRKQGGIGLGLALVKRFVELHGGQAWVEASPGKGSTFAFRIPKRPEKEIREKEVTNPLQTLYSLEIEKEEEKLGEKR
ncbi:Two component system histidine kinase [Methanosarcina siciliae C2J]|uniref:histidine kinase n=1 Tax=Methanosarcina siciliae C2J TaxID=1434118 RepID=A0A0E3PLX9_9EURY|nr:PAS domain S-box protein [Methanosarcina siciliae]AKB35829.1 Two component system histidine kinase [Methanosarcina siciliae C2J]